MECQQERDISCLINGFIRNVHLISPFGTASIKGSLCAARARAFMLRRRWWTVAVVNRILFDKQNTLRMCRVSDCQKSGAYLNQVTIFVRSIHLISPFGTASPRGEALEMAMHKPFP